MAGVAAEKPNLLGSRLAIVLVVAASLAMGGCAEIVGIDKINPFAAAKAPREPIPGQAPPNELQNATEYWGKAYSENPRDLDNALNYARNLKALGQKQQALGVLQQASMFHSTDKKLNSEYGRLALELDQVTVAKRLLEVADDPANPDWRVLSARGTVLAKEAQYSQAIAYYERALTLSSGQPSVMNNLALAYAMNGEAAKGEEVLRRAAASGASSAKVRQNLALVLGLQGKYDEATKVGSEVNSQANASANTDILKKMVRLDAKPYAPAAVPGAGWDTSVASSSSQAPGQAISASAAPAWKPAVVNVAAPAVPLRPASADSARAPSQTGQVVDASDQAGLRPSTR